MKKVAVWGDSISKGIVLDTSLGKYVRLHEEGYVPSVARALHIDVENYSKFGMTSDKGKQSMEKAFAGGFACNAAVIFFGGNDVDHNWPQIAQHPELEHFPNVPLDRFCQNIADMAAMVLEHNAEPVLATIPPIHAEKYFAWFSKGIEKSENILQWLGDVSFIYRMQELYNDAILETAKEINCQIVDVRKEFLNKRNYSAFLCQDGIHPNAKGHRLIEDTFIEYARQNVQWFEPKLTSIYACS